LIFSIFENEKTRTRMKEDEKIRLEREKQSSYQRKKEISGRLGGVAGGINFLNFHSPPDKD
jgi:hypothetical protein